MSFLSGLFGNNGSNFQAQSGNPINPVSGQAQTAVNQSQGAIQQQQALANALQQQGGVQNQSNVYSQLGQIASGQGPNPAQAQLSQATGQNVANQAALMAGQRGASQNAGLIARQAGQQGAATQQQAASQAANLQAQQSLGALGQQAGIAGQQVGNQLAAQGALTGAAQGQAGQLIGANTAMNTANIQNAQQQNVSNAAIAGINAQGQQNLLGGLTGALGSIPGLGGSGGALGTLGTAIGANEGGLVQSYDMGGVVAPQPMSSFAQSLAGKKTPAMFAQGGMLTPYAAGGKVPALVSPGEKYLPPGEVKKVEKGEKPAIKAGETIKGGSAKVPGDSLKNDTVKKDLTEGGIMIPRSITQGKNPGPAAAKFVEALLKKQGKSAKKVA